MSSRVGGGKSLSGLYLRNHVGRCKGVGVETW